MTDENKARAKGSSFIPPPEDRMRPEALPQEATTTITSDEAEEWGNLVAGFGDFVGVPVAGPRALAQRIDRALRRTYPINRVPFDLAAQLDSAAILLTEFHKAIAKLGEMVLTEVEILDDEEVEEAAPPTSLQKPEQAPPHVDPAVLDEVRAELIARGCPETIAAGFIGEVLPNEIARATRAREPGINGAAVLDAAYAVWNEARGGHRPSKASSKPPESDAEYSARMRDQRARDGDG